MTRPARALLLALCLTAACDRLRPAPAFHGTPLDPPAPAPPLRLPAAAPAGTPDPGAPAAAPRDTFDLARETARGRAALVFFGYTHCPDVCPTTLADWARVRRLLGDDARRVRFVFVTVDPERDTPAVVGRYVARFDPAIVGLVPSRAAVDAAQRAWGVASYREPAPAGTPDSAYAVAHPARVFAVDPQGRLRLTYPLNAPGAGVASDLRRLLR